MPGASEPEPGGAWYDYAIVRVVPRVERGEFLNAGIILFSRALNYLATRIELDVPRLLALDPQVDLERLRAHLASFEAIAAGKPEGGPIAAQPQSERFHWLTAPRSTMIQTSPVHVGRCTDPAAALEELMDRFVRRG